MRQKSTQSNASVEKTVRDIRRKTRRWHSTEEKIRIVLEGLRGEESIASLCRREGIAESLNNVTPADADIGRDTAIIERRKYQRNDHPNPSLEPSTPSGLTSKTDEPNPPIIHTLTHPKAYDNGHLRQVSHQRPFITQRHCKALTSGLRERPIAEIQ